MPEVPEQPIQVRTWPCSHPFVSRDCQLGLDARGVEKTGKPGLVGIVTGTIAGLATITPASGSVGPLGAIIIGASAGIICYYACGFIKEKLGVDDSLDVAAVHGIGGILGTLLVSYLGIGGTFGGLGNQQGNRK